MFDSSLHYPDKPEWKHEPAYREEVAARLAGIFRIIDNPYFIDEPYQRAIEQADYCLSLPMSTRQRMVAHWAQSKGYIGLLEWRRSSDALDDAHDLAEDLNDLPSCAEIAYTNGRVCAADLNYESSGDYNALTLSHLSHLNTSERSPDPDFESHVNLNLASANFTLERNDDARTNLEQAKTLLDFLPIDIVQNPERFRHVANIYWVEAILERWFGQLPIAYNTALRAYDMYSRLPPDKYLNEIATIGGVIAETAIDLADSLSKDPYSTARRTYLAVARSYIELAAKAANSGQNDLTAGITLLTHARFLAAVGRTAEAEHYVEVADMTANEQQNLAIAIQARTTRGRIYALCGEKNRALNCFQTALELARSSALPALGIWARRELLWDRELS